MTHALSSQRLLSLPSMKLTTRSRSVRKHSMLGPDGNDIVNGWRFILDEF